MDLGFWGFDFGVLILISGYYCRFWGLEFGIWNFCFWSLDTGVWSFEFGILDLGTFGTEFGFCFFQFRVLKSYWILGFGFCSSGV